MTPQEQWAYQPSKSWFLNTILYQKGGITNSEKVQDEPRLSGSARNCLNAQ